MTDGASSAWPRPDGPAIPPRVSRQAVQWLVALQADGAGEDVREDWRRWRAAHPDHERAWRHIEHFGAQLRQLDAPIAHGVLERPSAGAGRGRRQVLKALAGATVLGGGGWALSREGPLYGYRADYRTATGERRTLVLEDGSRVVLNTASAVDVRFDAALRRLVLARGEILVTTAPDPQAAGGAVARPFVVETVQGRVRALGTRFSVRQFDEDTGVSVFEQAVEVRPAEGAGRTVILDAGQQARFTRHAVRAVLPVADQADAWTRGMLVAHDMPLDAFVAELARHRAGRLACDPGVSALGVSGVYPLDDTDRVLDMLERTQPVRVARLTRYWVTVRGARP